MTGSTRGLGLAYAEALLEEGVFVVANGRGDTPPDLPHPDRWKYVAGDVASPRQAEALVTASIERFGRLDALVNNAGIYRDRTLLKMSDAEFDEVVKSHLYGTFHCGRAAARTMKEQGRGRIINVSSDAATGAFGQSNYAAAKAGIVGLTMTWAIELQRYGIWVNAFFPNAATDEVLGSEGLAERWGYGGPFPRSMGEPSEATSLVAYLVCSEKAEGLTGQILALGGDRLALWHGLQEVKTVFKSQGWSYGDLEDRLGSLFGLLWWTPGFEP